ncbi:MAG: hypothetical protein KGJ86_21535, partial [Chloroflexota bacterium]|nr:hypothetical protein [Chloroflexota bacterium]
MARTSLVDLVKQHVELAEWDRAERRVRQAAERTGSQGGAGEIIQAVLALAAEYGTWNRREQAE